jgi:tetratricopeptide (TPR) repeat protein
LLQEISGPPAPIEQAFKHVKDKVYTASAQQQRPWLLFDTIGDFLFAQADAAPAAKEPELDAVLEKGRNEFQAGRFADAVATFEAALRLDQNNAYTLNALGAARMRTGQASSAVSLFSRAIALKPDYAAAYYNRGVLYYNTSDQYGAAIKDFSWAIDEDENDPRPYDLRGKCYLALSENELALADFNRALELNPSDSAALLGRGRIWFRKRQNAEAIRDLTDSIAIRPAGETFAVRSQAFLAAGRRAEADADRKRAESLQTR